MCAFLPQKSKFGFWPSYLGYTLGRFILACTTRGIAIIGFVLGKYRSKMKQDQVYLIFVVRKMQLSFLFSLATELVGPKNKFLVAIIIQYCFALGQLILVAFAYFIREWRRLTYTLSIFTIPFLLLHL
jgi:hypothetical protein